MKKILLSSLVAAAAAMPAFAGVDNINYQAVIKNGNEVVANSNIALKFELIDKADAVVYTEVKDVTTNAAGVATCQLGADDALSTIEWGDLTLRVSINFGAGYQVISNEAVSSVPTALYALRSADTEAIMGDLERMMVDVESNKTSILGVNAELARVDGFIEDQDAFNTDIVEKVGPMMGLNYDEVMDQFDRLHTEIISLQNANNEAEQNFANLGENLDNFGNEVNTKLGDVEGQLENLNNVAAVVRANEEAIEALQGDFKNLGENLDNLVTEMNAKFDDVNGQLENLNNVAAVVRVNEENIEALQGDFKNLDENLTNAFQVKDAEIAEINGQIENLNMVAAVVRVNEENIETITTELQKTQKESEETAATVRSMGADIAQIEGLAETSEQLVDAVQALEKDNGETKSKLLSMSADIAQIEGLANEVTEMKSDLDSTFEVISINNERVMEQIEQIVPAVQALQSDNEETKTALRSVTADVAQIEGLASEIEALQAEIAALKAEIAKLKGE